MISRALVLWSASVLLANTDARNLNEQLFQAIHRGDLAGVQKLIGQGAAVNAKDTAGRTPLMHAALYSTSDCVKSLLASGADVNAAAGDGATALMYALPDPVKVRMLIEKGANVSARLNDGKTVLILAVRQDGAADIVRLLLAKGAIRWPRTTTAARR